MKILVVSDNHGDRDILVDIAKTWDTKVDGLFHCGDSELDSQDELWQKYVVVKGNCDYSSDYQNDCTIKMNDEVIYITHGHLLNVNLGLEMLYSLANKNKATIALYGHTHKLDSRMEKGILLVNPGSISQPRGEYKHLKTYVIITTEKKMIHVNYYNRQHQMIEELSFSFEK